jgi:plasmid stabilization system protein ParE
MKRFKFNRFALSEMIEAAHYYENEQTGLGKDFLKKVRKALDHVRSFPDSGTSLGYGMRRHTIRRFHYSVIYSDEAEHIYIASIMHQSRHPDHWKDRIKDVPFQ